jgi:hypothetical protein
VIHRFTCAEDNFGNSVAKRAVMVDIGEPQIFERQMAHPMQRRIDIGCTGTHVFEQRPQLIFRHPLKW